MSVCERKSYIIGLMPDLCGVIPPLASIIAEYDREIEFAPQDNFELFDNGTTAEKTSETGWRSIFSKQPLSSQGIQTVSFYLPNKTGPESARVGLAPAGSDPGGYVGWHYGWCYCSFAGNFSGPGNSTGRIAKGTAWDTEGPHTITMIVNFDADTISFSHNGVPHGVVFSDLKLKSQGPLHPTFAGYYPRQRVTLSLHN